MAVHDYVISNGTGSAVRSDLNGALAAIVSNNSGATEPTTMYAYQWWADTTTGLLKQRNAANSAWVTIGTLASANLGLLSLAGGTMTGVLAVTAGTAALPGIAVSGDLNTGLVSPGADQLAITTGGTSRLAVSTTAVSSTLPVDVPLGAVGTPSLTFTGDLNTGIYSPGADQLAISTNGTSRIVFDASGNVNIDSNTLYVDAANNRVGIGTTSPVSELDVNGRISAIAGTSGAPSFNCRTDTNTGINLPEGDRIQFIVGGNEAARIDASSRLLVGTSSTSASTNLLVTNGDAGKGVINIASTSATPADGEDLGYISFNDSAHIYNNAIIRAQRDGGTWTATTSKPTRLTFSTTADGSASPTEHARINAAGALKVSSSGTYGNATSSVNEFYQTNNSAALNARAVNASFTDSVFAVDADRNTTNNTYFFIRASVTGVAYRFNVADSGNVTNTNNSYGAISDIKLKENIVDATSQWSDIKALQVRKYNFKEDQTHTQIGLVAQEVELVSPGLVGESPDRDEDGNDLGTVTKSVNYSVLYMKAVKALQEAMDRIEALEASNADLLARVAALEAA